MLSLSLSLALYIILSLSFFSLKHSLSVKKSPMDVIATGCGYSLIVNKHVMKEMNPSIDPPDGFQFTKIITSTRAHIKAGDFFLCMPEINGKTHSWSQKNNVEDF